MKLYIYISTILISLLFNTEADYTWPTDVSKTVTAFFGEMRPNRYHYGIDIRTYGQNGKNIYSISDGYVYRVKISSDGYGKVIYIKLKDGNIALYSHLSKFNDKIEQIVSQMQKMRNSYGIDHLLEPGLIPISKGEIIGYTGDTGSLSGPHLHFEIRDEINRPFNPFKTSLKKNFIDTKEPIPRRIAFIPRSSETKIEGLNHTHIYNVNKNEEEYYIKDTVQVVGEFGIAIDVIDKVDDQPFSYGIYSMDLFIDNKYQYGIKFDKTTFSQSDQAYIERDYDLISDNKGEFYRLFKSNYENNHFIEDKSKKINYFEEGIHSFKINIKDINQNKTTLSGFIAIRNPIDFNYEFYQLAMMDGWRIDIKDIEKIEKAECALTTQYNNGKEIIPEFEILEDTSLIIHNVTKAYNLLKLKLYLKNGVTKVKYISLDDSHNENEKIWKESNGYISFDHTYRGIFINFTENEFSNLIPSLIFRKDSILNKIPMIRKDKNTLTSQIFSIKEFLELEDIKIEYNNGDYIYSKEVKVDEMLTYPNLFSEKSFRNEQVLITHNKNTFFDTTLIYITNPHTEIKDNRSIIFPFYIGPNSIPFNNEIEFSINLFNEKNIDHYVISNYNEMKGVWSPIETERNEKTVKGKIERGSIIGVIIDNTKPEINNIIPRDGATYKLNDLDDFEIFITDDYSKIDYKNGIQLKLNNTILLTGYNIYQKKILCDIRGHALIGENIFELIVTDKAN